VDGNPLVAYMSTCSEGWQVTDLPLRNQPVNLFRLDSIRLVWVIVDSARTSTVRAGTHYVGQEGLATVF
jgi:hypothetical protein